MKPIRDTLRLMVIGLLSMPLGMSAQSEPAPPTQSDPPTQGEAAASTQDAPVPSTGLHNTVFTEYSPLTRNADFLRRVLTPLAVEAMQRKLTASGKAMVEQSIDLSKEEFLVYVPARVPADGYALMVFVPPWHVAILPSGWARVLDEYGVIFVAAEQSGNDDNVLARREPLALLEVQNITARYTVNPKRILIGGFSGGSRVALRLAVYYPDVFHGAFLNAGSDPIGASAIPLPSKDLLHQIQESLRVVYVTGAKDGLHVSMDAESIKSMQKYCVYDVDSRGGQWLGHEIADARGLSEGLEFLLRDRSPPEQARLDKCREGVQHELVDKLDGVEKLLTEGKRSAAHDQILKINSSFGAFAAPRIVELAERCDCKLIE